MKFSAMFTALALLATSALAQSTVTVSYDQTYDNAGQSLDTVACSDGPEGLDPPYSTFGDLPDFPYIGGAAAIAGWGSDQCGTCWQLQYTTPTGTPYTVNVLAIDHTDAGFNIGLTAFNALVGGDGTFVGRVDATATQVDKSVCGL
ncbi:Cerato-platanin [Rhodofomes roseus]|uniref:Cerato-platanin n=1 Tax=Rhodofomes roseus TaxID=34475 RepID=A0ABQ8KUC3_9APHY|nr:Cerato-platanin [Rhodofomes roseus]KAH9842672.1 Cerato-platanin [Rhodofomes roseus]